MAAGTNVLKLAGRLGLAHNLTEVYKPCIAGKRSRLIELLKGKTTEVRNTEFARKMRTIKGHYNLEIAPPSTAQEFAQLKTDINLTMDFLKTGCYKHLTVKQAWLLFLVATEVSLWFYLGETIGKMHMIGYKVHV